MDDTEKREGLPREIQAVSNFQQETQVKIRDLRKQAAANTKRLAELYSQMAEVEPGPLEPEYVPEVVITLKPRSEWPAEFRQESAGAGAKRSIQTEDAPFTPARPLRNSKPAPRKRNPSGKGGSG